MVSPINPDVWFHAAFPGGGWPPSIFLLWYKYITFNTFLESHWALLQYLQKIANFPKTRYSLRNLVIMQKFWKKNAQIATNYTFFKNSEPRKYKSAKHFQNFQNLNVYSRKLKIGEFPLKASVQKSVQYFFAKIVLYGCFCYRLSKALYNVEIQWLEVGLNMDLSGIGKIRH